jgi:hypothetical protein
MSLTTNKNVNKSSDFDALKQRIHQKLIGKLDLSESAISLAMR